MGNVQCCASGRFHEGKLPNKPKDKNKKKKSKGINKKSNGVSGGKKNGSVQKVVTVAEDGSERAAPTEAQTQAAPAGDAPGIPAPPVAAAPGAPAPSDPAPDVSETDGPKTESTAAARERFFNQVNRFQRKKIYIHFKWRLP